MSDAAILASISNARPQFTSASQALEESVRLMYLQLVSDGKQGQARQAMQARQTKQAEAQDDCYATLSGD
jgi:hypothetical protein